MEQLSLDINKSVSEVEKQVLSSGKMLQGLRELMDVVQHDGRPRPNIRNFISASIIAMERINRQAGFSPSIFSVKSLEVALELLQSTTDCNYVKKDKRRRLLEDMVTLYETVTDLNSDSAAGDMRLLALRNFLRPNTKVFDGVTDDLDTELRKALLSAGACRIMVDAPTLTGLSQVQQGFSVQVDGFVTEEQFQQAFVRAFEKARIDEGDEIPAPPIIYNQYPIDDFKLVEEAGPFVGIGMGAHEVRFLGSTSSEEGLFNDGGVGRGTVGAILRIKEYQGHSDNEPKETTLGKMLFGLDEDEDEDEDEKDHTLTSLQDEGVQQTQKLRKMKCESFENLFVITAAHVAYGKLKMPKDKSNKDLLAQFNKDQNIRALYTEQFDVALLSLPQMKVFSQDKLHISPSCCSRSSDWSCKLSNLEIGATVVKIGAKTGITVGKYAGIKGVLDPKNENATYKNCVAVRHAENDGGRFCKPGDSGSIYFVLRRSNKKDVEDETHDVLEWCPIAIHRTSDNQYSYGSPLKESIDALVSAKKLNRCTVDLIPYVFEYSDKNDQEGGTENHHVLVTTQPEKLQKSPYSTEPDRFYVVNAFCC